MAAQKLLDVQTLRMPVTTGFRHASKPFTHLGLLFPSMLAFCRHYGLHWSTVRSRIKRGIADERLLAKRLKRTTEH
jgi:hypothetical protein